MKAERKIAMVVNHVKMEDEDSADVAYWLSRPPAERLAEVVRLRKTIIAGPMGVFGKRWRKLLVKERCNIQ